MAKYNPYLIPVHCSAKVSRNAIEQSREAAGEDFSLCPSVVTPLCLSADNRGGSYLGCVPLFGTGVSQNLTDDG